MNYRIVCRGRAGDKYGVSPWQDSPKGLQLKVLELQQGDTESRYWVEEGKRHGSVMALMEALKDSVAASKKRRARS